MRRGLTNPLAFLEHLASTSEEVIPFRLGKRQAFLLNSAPAIEEVLVRRPQHFDKGRGYLKAAQFLGDGLLTLEDEPHRERRQTLQPAFHRSRLEAAARSIVRRAVECRDRWQPGTPIDIGRQMRELTLAIAGDALFGADLTSWKGVVSSAITRALASVDGLVAIVAPPAKARQARRELDAVVDAILATRRQSPQPHDDLLSILTQAAANDPDGVQQLRDDVVTFLVAGHDTISLGLTWTWSVLADHPEVDDQLGHELDEVLGRRIPESVDIGRLTYTRAVLRETLRLYPPAWVIVRRALRPLTLCGVDVPEGALVVASPYVTHRDARYFPDPGRFDPTRWLSPEREAALPRLAYFPFGAGPRACIGEGFAWMEGTLVLATLAQRWRLSKATQSRTRPVARATLRPENVPPLLAAMRSC